MTGAPAPVRGRSRQPGGGLFGALPLLAISVIVYNVMALTVMGGFVSQAAQATLSQQLFVIPMTSGGRWPVTVSDLLLSGSLVLLFIELLRSTTSRNIAILNHGLSMALFILCLVEFLLGAAFATSTFFLLCLMQLLDVLAGFIMTIVSARRDVDYVAGP
jgi:hypothetical protein